MIHVAGQTDVFWTVAVGMGFAVFAVVVVLLNLLYKSAQALDQRVDHVWLAAAGVHGNTESAAPQIRTAEQIINSVLQPATTAPTPAASAARPFNPTGGSAPRPAAPSPAAPTTPPPAAAPPAPSSEPSTQRTTGGTAPQPWRPW